jgi:hypothetical protein
MPTCQTERCYLLSAVLQIPGTIRGHAILQIPDSMSHFHLSYTPAWTAEVYASSTLI